MSSVADLAIMVEQQIAFIKRDLPQLPLLPLPVQHEFLSIHAAPLMALSDHLRSLGFHVSEPERRSYTDEIGLQHSFHGLCAKSKNIVDFDLLYAAAVRAFELAEKFDVTYDRFIVDVGALRSDV